MKNTETTLDITLDACKAIADKYATVDIHTWAYANHLEFVDKATTLKAILDFDYDDDLYAKFADVEDAIYHRSSQWEDWAYERKSKEEECRDYSDDYMKLYGAEYEDVQYHDFQDLVAWMNDEIREQVHNELAPCYPQEFLDRYVELHEKKYHEAFVVG